MRLHTRPPTKTKLTLHERKKALLKSGAPFLCLKETALLGGDGFRFVDFART